MESKDFTLFKRFTNVEQAKQLASLLKENGIDYQLIDNSPIFDVTFSGSKLDHEVQLLLKPVDFEQANQLLEGDGQELMDEVTRDHYLFDFSDQELYEILIKPDEWSNFDYRLAGEILQERGQAINEELLAALKAQRNQELAKPEEGQQPWIIVGYFLAVMGGLLGLVIG